MSVLSGETAGTAGASAAQASSQGTAAAGALPGIPAPAMEWKSALPEVIRNHPVIQQTPDIEKLAKQLVDAQSFIGRSIQIPGANATPEEINKFHVKLGRPESIDKYSKLDYTGLPPGLEVPPEKISEYHNLAFKLGLNDAQQKGVLQWIHANEVADAKGQEEQQQLTRANSESVLKKEFGAAYDQRIAIAQRAYGALATKDQQEYFKEIGLEDDPQFIKMLAEIGKKLVDDRSIDGSGGVGSLKMTPDEANVRIAEIRKDPKHPYNDAASPAHAQAVADMQKLYEVKVGK